MSKPEAREEEYSRKPPGSMVGNISHSWADPAHMISASRFYNVHWAERAEAAGSLIGSLDGSLIFFFSHQAERRPRCA